MTFDYFNFCLLPFGPNEILIIGGACNKGFLKTVHLINLEDQTIINKGTLINWRASFKYFIN